MSKKVNSISEVTKYSVLKQALHHYIVLDVILTSNSSSKPFVNCLTLTGHETTMDEQFFMDYDVYLEGVKDRQNMCDLLQSIGGKHRQEFKRWAKTMMVEENKVFKISELSVGERVISSTYYDGVVALKEGGEKTIICSGGMIDWHYTTWFRIVESAKDVIGEKCTPIGKTDDFFLAAEIRRCRVELNNAIMNARNAGLKVEEVDNNKIQISRNY